MEIYIMHYTKLEDRRENIEKLLISTGLSEKFHITWITEFDRENITAQDIKTNYLYNKNILSRPLTLPEIANGMAHNSIIEKISSGTEPALILEDDIILHSNFLYHLEKCIKYAPEDWEILTLGGHYDDGTGYYDGILPNLELNLQDKNELYFSIEIPKKLCTTVSCYVLKPSLAKRIIKHHLFKPFSAPIDETLCHILPDIYAKIYWTRPWLAYEGSKKGGLFSSSLGRGF